MKEKTNNKKDLLEVLSKISRDKYLLNGFLQAILTEQEYEDIALRWRVFKDSVSGASQRDIQDHLGISISKVTRGVKVTQEHKKIIQKIINLLKDN